ncbi:hypothetical protein [Nostoc punctiforme]|uniref:Uncharacterized protein n=1 Tax=Nostoc punctiforme (strain ATCC 29133 / PCC 73102) TaxID=63737 RepID=B2JAD7_NOSP7|nr:hypothetical protein [Nostoc punctiforme]ACC84891.1 hypothetical protein Npun_AF001 [Nostoc punctiforme PCC 73102]
MQKVKEILLAQGIEFDEADIVSAASAIGMELDGLNDAEASAIALKVVELKQASGLALSQKDIAAKSRNGNGKLGKNSPRRKSTPPLQGAIAHASQVSNQEIQSLEDVLNVGIDAYTTDKADKLLSTIRNAPKDVVSKFVSKAMEEEADVDSFRAIGDELVAGIFGAQFTNAAE